VLVGRMDEGMSHLILLAVPLFVFLGLLIEMTGMARAMVAFLASLLGHVRGGLHYVLVGAMYLVSGISGSKAADMAAVAPVLFPEMKKRGAKPGDLVALLAATGAQTETIPPSLVLITIGSVTGVSISALFTGGLLPGVVLAITLSALVWWRYRREDLSHQRVPDDGGLIGEIPPVQVQQVEEERRQRNIRALLPGCGLGAGPAGGDLKGPGPAIGVQRDRLTVQDQGSGWGGEHSAGDLGQPGGDVVEGPGKHPDLRALPVHLDPDPVDLPLDRRRAHPFEGGRHGRGGGSQHRPQGQAYLQPERPEHGKGGRRGGVVIRGLVTGCVRVAGGVRRGLIVTGSTGGGQGCLRHGGQRTAEQVRPAHLAGVHPGGPRDGLDHHAFQRALVQFAGEQPGQEGLLGRPRPGEHGPEQPPPLGLGPGTDGSPDGREHGIGLGQGQRAGRRIGAGGAGGGRRGIASEAARARAGVAQQAAQGRVPHPDLPLAQFAREKRDRHRNLIRRRPAQQPRDLVDLDPAAGRQRYGL